ncbi:MAG: insulinase family protein [Myxococcales bacterium]|nr:insulinase family protein [Myxococcales bacterium]
MIVLGVLAALASEVGQSQLDARQYRAITLDNGLRAMLVSDPDIAWAAAAVAVHRGSSADPPERLGLAHLYEHMLFRGTVEDPTPDGFQRFVEDHGGNRDATTHMEETVYSFEVPRADFDEAFHRFSGFFTQPLLAADGVAIERLAVESEFRLRLEEEGRKIASVAGYSHRLDHPMSRFTVGNLDTLGDRDGEDLATALRAFRDACYTADQMTLAIIDRRSLDALEDLVRDELTAVPAGPAAPLPERPSPFEDGHLGAEIRVDLPHRSSIRMRFLMPPEDEVWDQHPLDLLADLLGDEGDGSVLAELRARGWAQALRSSSDTVVHDHAQLDLEAVLTEEGMANRDAVVALVLQYVEGLTDDTLRRVYEENATNAALAFRFSPETRPLRGMEAVALQLHHRPVEHVLDAWAHFAPFDPEVHRRFRERIVPGNLRLYTYLEGIPTDTVTSLYRTPFAVEPFGPERLAAFAKRDPSAHLAAPAPNPYIAQEVPPIPPRWTRNAPKARKTRVDGLALWLNPDGRFREPRQVTELTLVSQQPIDEPVGMLRLQAFAAQLERHLVPVTYPAERAGIGVRVDAVPDGVRVRLVGFDEPHLRLLADIVARIQTFEVDPVGLEAAKVIALDGHQRFHAEVPVEVALAIAHGSLDPAQVFPANQTPLVAAQTPAEIQAFADVFFSVAAARLLLFGNVDPRRARDYARAVEPLVHPGGLGRTRLRHMDEPVVIDFDSPQGDSAVVWHAQSPRPGPEGQATTELLEALVRTDFFAQLRTEEQIGYVVAAWGSEALGVGHLDLVVQSNVAGPEALEARIRRYIEELPEAIRALDDATLDRVRDQVYRRLLQGDSSLVQRAQRVSESLDIDDPDVYHLLDVATFAHVTTRDELIEAAEALLTHTVVVRVRGQANPTPETERTPASCVYPDCDGVLGDLPSWSLPRR